MIVKYKMTVNNIQHNVDEAVVSMYYTFDEIIRECVNKFFKKWPNHEIPDFVAITTDLGSSDISKPWEEYIIGMRMFANSVELVSYE